MDQPFGTLDVKLGNQIVAWGVANSLRVVDVLNPTDNREFGMTDLEDIRLPATMTRLDYYIDDLKLEAVAVHQIKFNKIAPYGSDFNPSSLKSTEVIPESNAENTEFGLAVIGTFNGWDGSLHWAQYFDDTAHTSKMTQSMSGKKIEQNTGNIFRLAACLGLSVDIIEPTGFIFEDKRFRRSSMDYINHVDYKKHIDWDSFYQWSMEQHYRLILLTTKSQKKYYEYKYKINDILPGSLKGSIHLDNVKKTSEGVLGRPHLAREMVRLKIVSNSSEAFDEYLSPYNVEKKNLAAKEAIHLIRQSGGVPVVAHPGERQYSLYNPAKGRDFKDVPDMVDELISDADVNVKLAALSNSSCTEDMLIKAGKDNENYSHYLKWRLYQK